VRGPKLSGAARTSILAFPSRKGIFVTSRQQPIQAVHRLIIWCVHYTEVRISRERDVLAMGGSEMTDRQDWEQPPPQQGYGQQPQDAPWQRQQYDPYVHQQRLGAPPQGTAGQQYGPQGQPWPQEPPQFTPPPDDPRQYTRPHQQPGWDQAPLVPQPEAQPPRQPRRKSWPARHKVLTAFGAFGALLVIIVAATSASNKPTTMASDTGAASSSASPSAAVSSAPASTAPSTSAAPASSAPSTSAAPAGPSMTGSQQQAVDAATGYLSDGQGFSAQGLLGQLTSSAGNGFSQSDAEFAINYLNPNWDQQAVDAANGYLSGGQGFSEQGLLQQLTSSAGSGFTEAQAEYAINSVNPDWDAQAVDAAKGYMQMGGFSEASLIQQLTSSAGNGFTQAQAEYAASQVGL